MASFTRQGIATVGVLLLCGAALPACRSSELSQVEVEVRSVGVDQASRSPVVVLQDKEKRVALPIWIGPAEAQAIAMQMEGVNPPRPMTHDLMKSALEQTGVEFQKVIISDLRDSTYYARIVLRNGRKDIEIDSRPSDAIALAVRFQKPIFIATALLKQDVVIDLRGHSADRGAATMAGVTMQDLNADLAEHFQLPVSRGVLISNVAGGAGAGLQRGDVIVEVDGETVGSVGALQEKLGARRSGSRVDLSVQRGPFQVHVDFTTE